MTIDKVLEAISILLANSASPLDDAIAIISHTSNQLEDDDDQLTLLEALAD